MDLLSVFKKIFGTEEKSEPRKEVDRSETREFSIDSAIKSLEKKLDENFQSFKEDVRKSYEDVQSKLKDFKNSLESLEKTKVGEDSDAETLRLNTALISLANAHKKSFVEKMYVMISQLDKPLGTDLDSIIRYQQSALHSVVSADEKTSKDYDVFKDMVKVDVVKRFRLLYTTVKNFDRSVNEKVGDVLSVKKALEEAFGIKNDTEVLERSKSSLESIVRELADLQVKHSLLEERMKKLEKDESYLSFLDRREALQSEISSVKSEIYQNFYLIDKPLRKFRHSVQKNAEVEEKFIDMFLESPIEALVRTGNFTLLNSVLVKLRADILEGKLETKNKEKIAQGIKAVVDHDAFKELIARYSSLEEELERLEDDRKVKEVLKSKEEVGSELELVVRGIEAKKEELERIKKLVEKMEVSVKERTDRLEKTIISYTH